MQRWPLILGLPGTSIQQKDKESSLNIAPPSYMGSGLEAKKPTSLSSYPEARRITI
jgi:hypothetical protein